MSLPAPAARPRPAAALLAVLALALACGPSGLDAELVAEVRAAAQPWTGAPEELDALAARLAEGTELVLLGDATHGTQEFYVTRAELTRRLVADHGFRGVVIEGEWADALRVHRFVQGAADEDPLAGFRRFPVWMWRNTATRDFVGWLRAHAATGAAVGFYGMDAQELSGPLRELGAYLEAVDPQAAADVVAPARACFGGDEASLQRYARRIDADPGSRCDAEVAQVLARVRAGEHFYARAGDAAAREAWVHAELSARALVASERYVQASVHGGTVPAWNARDLHMADVLDVLAAHLGADGARGKLVVWTHNSHVSDARATERAAEGEVTLGQAVRVRRGAGRVALVGMTTYIGTVAAAEETGRPVKLFDVVRGREEAYEGAFHATGLPAFRLDLRGADLPHADDRRPLRAIGVVYRPGHELQSHYLDVGLADAFDHVLHLDVTRAVTPLERPALWPVAP